MTFTDTAVANLQRTTAWWAADACARRIFEYAGPRAVTIDPQGRVWVEPVEEAAEVDLVGVYTRNLGLFELNKLLKGDIEAALAERRPTRVRRRYGPRARREAA